MVNRQFKRKPSAIGVGKYSRRIYTLVEISLGRAILRTKGKIEVVDVEDLPVYYREIVKV